MTDKERITELIFNLFAQGCFDNKTKKYNHGFISAYEDAQEYLLSVNKINQEECEYL